MNAEGVGDELMWSNDNDDGKLDLGNWSTACNAAMGRSDVARPACTSMPDMKVVHLNAHARGQRNRTLLHDYGKFSRA
jgi:hypothetical protein